MRRGGQRALCSSTVLDSLAGIKTVGVWIEMAEIKSLPEGCRGPCVFPMEQSAEREMEATRSCLGGLGVITKSKRFSTTAWVHCGQLDVVVKARIYKDPQGVFLELARRRGDCVLFVRVFEQVRKAL